LAEQMLHVINYEKMTTSFVTLYLFMILWKK